jgi:hypothetical protein
MGSHTARSPGSFGGGPGGDAYRVRGERSGADLPDADQPTCGAWQRADHDVTTAHHDRASLLDARATSATRDLPAARSSPGCRMVAVAHHPPTGGAHF